MLLNHGDITKINGSNVEPVDCIIGGSPCQDLSIAGSKKGLSGSQSCLFLEQMRVIKEMRLSSKGRKPRYMVWEVAELLYKSFPKEIINELTKLVL